MWSTTPSLSRGLKIDRNDARVWYSLEIIEGGRVGTEHFTKAGCLTKALKFGPNVAKAWCHRGTSSS